MLLIICIRFGSCTLYYMFSFQFMYVSNYMYSFQFMYVFNYMYSFQFMYVTLYVFFSVHVCY